MSLLFIEFLLGFTGDKLAGEVSRIVAAEAWHWTLSLPRVKFMKSTQLRYVCIEN